MTGRNRTMHGRCRVGASWPGLRDAEVDGLSAAASVDLAELVVSAGEADLESFDLAEPAFAFGFGDAGGEVVADLGDAGPLGGVGPEQQRMQASLNFGAVPCHKASDLPLRLLPQYSEFA
jgi:hypothetical protein